MEETSDGPHRTGKQQQVATNRKKYEDELQILLSTLKEKEVQLKSLSVKSEERVEQELVTLLRDKETQGQRRQSTDTDLRRVSQEISKQESELARIQSKLIYRDETKLNNTIRRLENELSTRNFKLKEEKKIVAEIDSLKRSKKDLYAFQAVKKQIEEKRDEQRRLRDDRDRSYKEEKRLQQRHSLMRQESSKHRHESETLRQEITELRSRIKGLQGELGTLESNHTLSSVERSSHQTLRRRHTIHTQRDKPPQHQLQHQHQQHHQQLQQHQQQNHQQQQLRERTTTLAVYDGKKMSAVAAESKSVLSLTGYRSAGAAHAEDDVAALCNMLIKYLQRFNTPATTCAADENECDITQVMSRISHETVENTGENCAGGVEEIEVLERSLEAEGLHLLKRKLSVSEHDLTLPSCRTSRASRRKNRVQAKKPLSHTPEIFEQFSRVGLEPPACATDVPASITELQNKMKTCRTEVHGRDTIKDNTTDDISSSSSCAQVRNDKASLPQKSQQQVPTDNPTSTAATDVPTSGTHEPTNTCAADQSSDTGRAEETSQKLNMSDCVRRDGQLSLNDYSVTRLLLQDQTVTEDHNTSEDNLGRSLDQELNTATSDLCSARPGSTSNGFLTNDASSVISEEAMKSDQQPLDYICRTSACCDVVRTLERTEQEGKCDNTLPLSAAVP